MASFFRLFGMTSVVIALFLCTAILAQSKIHRRQQNKRAPDGMANSVSYRSIRGPKGTSCRLAASTDGESIFQAFFMGSEYIRTACGKDEFWFWMPTYSRDRFFFCPSDELDRVGLSPMFRPSFVRFVSGLSIFDKRRIESGVLEFQDGEFKVLCLFDGGQAKEQVYTYEEKPMLTVRIEERQIVGGLSLPKSVSIEVNEDRPKEVFQMGTPEINPAVFPKLEPPNDKIRTRLEWVR